MGWGNAISRVFKWVDNFRNKKGDKNESQATKAAMSGDERVVRDSIVRLFGKRKKRK